jgi:hypothetical protein
MITVAALFVDARGAYSGLEGVEVWDESRDARRYRGPHPVVAHPPCSRWCRLAGLVRARWGHEIGDDGGCFFSALRSLRRYGGVLEHPAYSKAWAKYRLPVPHRAGGWNGDPYRGWSCHVEQGRYGHCAKKATWLYAYGIDRLVLPDLRWGSVPDCRGRAPVSWCRSNPSDSRVRVEKRATSATPMEFRDLLIGMARLSRGGKAVDLNRLPVL